MAVTDDRRGAPARLRPAARRPGRTLKTCTSSSISTSHRSRSACSRARSAGSETADCARRRSSTVRPASSLARSTIHRRPPPSPSSPGTPLTAHPAVDEASSLTRHPGPAGSARPAASRTSERSDGRGPAGAAPLRSGLA